MFYTNELEYALWFANSMVEISSKFSRFSESFFTIRLVPTNHHGTHAMKSLPLACLTIGDHNFVLINPHKRRV